MKCLFPAPNKSFNALPRPPQTAPRPIYSTALPSGATTLNSHKVHGKTRLKLNDCKNINCQKKEQQLLMVVLVQKIAQVILIVNQGKAARVLENVVFLVLI